MSTLRVSLGVNGVLMAVVVVAVLGWRSGVPRRANSLHSLGATPLDDAVA